MNTQRDKVRTVTLTWSAFSITAGVSVPSQCLACQMLVVAEALSNVSSSGIAHARTVYSYHMPVRCTVTTCPYGLQSPHPLTVYSHHMPVRCTVTTCPYGVQSPHARTVYSHHMPLRCTVTTCPYGVQSPHARTVYSHCNLQAPSDGAKFIAFMSTNMGTKTSPCWVVSGLWVISRENLKHHAALLTAAVI